MTASPENVLSEPRERLWPIGVWLILLALVAGAGVVAFLSQRKTSGNN